MEGDSFEVGNPVFLALRDYYLLLPEGERAAFVASYLGRPLPRGGETHALLSAALLHGLSGDRVAAGRDLDRLLARRTLATEPDTLSPDARRWSYLLANGEQLQAWNLDALAIHLWRGALHEVGAFDREPGDVDNLVQEIRRRLLSVEVANAPDPERARELVAAFLAEAPESAAVAAMAAQLWSDGQRPAAARLYEILCQTDPADTDYWPNLFGFYESTGSDGAAERLLEFMLAGARVPPPGTSRADLTCSLAALREKRGDGAGALRLLEHARLAMPGALPVMFALAQAFERADRWEDAAAAWRDVLRLDLTHTARLGLAAVEERQGLRAAAVETLRGGLRDGPDPGRTELVVRLTQLLLADHRPDEARALASELLDKDELEPLPAVAAALTAGGQKAAAREILAAAVLRARAPAARFHLQQALAEQDAEPGKDPAVFIRDLRRLEKLSQASASLRAEYEALLYPLAHRQGADTWLEGELRRVWNDGRGDPTAGAQLAGLSLQNHRDDTLREVIQAIDRRPDLPEKLLFALATSLIEADHAPLATGLCERLVRRFPQKQEYALARAQALWKSGRPADADQVLRDLAAAAIFRDDALEAVAAFYLQHDDKARATVYLRQIVEADPMAARSPQSFLRLAQIALDDKRVDDAGRLLRVAYARPPCDDLGPLVRYLVASGALDGDDARRMPARDFPLTFTRRARLLAAVRDQLVGSGRPDEARRLIEEHAEFLAGVPVLAETLAREATPATVGTVAACLERAVGERSPPDARLGHSLAGLYARWAGWDANAPATRIDALTHLSRACELEPDNFEVAAQLAKLCLAQQQPARAREVLAAFLADGALPGEREQANDILAR